MKLTGLERTKMEDLGMSNALTETINYMQERLEKQERCIDKLYKENADLRMNKNLIERTLNRAMDALHAEYLQQPESFTAESLAYAYGVRTSVLYSVLCTIGCGIECFGLHGVANHFKELTGHGEHTTTE